MEHSIEFLKFSKISKCGYVTHGITTRNGGVSGGKYESMNLSFHVGDSSSCVLNNRKRVTKLLGINLDNMTVGKQSHSSNIAVVTSQQKGRGARSYGSAISNVDALITAEIDLCLGVLAADCSPILILDRTNHVISVIHAGREGSLKRIISRTIETLVSKFQSRYEDLLVGIGPSITGGNYPINTEKGAKLLDVLGTDTNSLTRTTKGFNFDLQTAHMEELNSLGIKTSQIDLMEACTYSNPKLFFSERRDGSPTGRFALLAFLNK